MARRVQAIVVALVTAFMVLPGGSVLAGHGSIIYDNGPPLHGNGVRIVNHTAADDFSLAQTRSVEDAGVYLSTVGTGLPGDFSNAVSWFIFEDAGGTPSSVPVASGIGVNLAFNSTGFVDVLGQTVWLLEFDLDNSFAAQAGVTYWFGVNLPGSNANVFWVSSAAPGNVSFSSGTTSSPFSWSQFGNMEMAFFLTGGDDPCDPSEITVDLGAGDKPTKNDDVILGTPGDDEINASRGDDTICIANGGNDTVHGGFGDDWVDELSAGDIFNGSHGDDTVAWMTGGTFNGGNDNDTVEDQSGGDFFGGRGCDVVVSMSGGFFDAGRESGCP